MPLSLLPGIYVCACVFALVAVLRRGLGEPLPWRVALALLVLVLAVFSPVLLGGQILLPLDTLRGYAPFGNLPAPPVHGNYLQADLVTLIAPALARLRAAGATGAWGLWNPLVGTGVPLLADPQAQAFQPLQLLALPFPLPVAAGVVAALRVLVAMSFTFLFLRRQRIDEGAALAGAFAWGLGGFLLLWLGWPLANVGALLPMALWASALALDRGERRDLAVLALATMALLLGGHPEAEVYAGAFCAAFAFARARAMQQRMEGPSVVRRRLVRAAFAAGVGVLLALPVALPAMRAASQSQRAAGLLARRAATAGSVHVVAPEWETSWGRFARGRLLPIFAPNAFGNSRYLHYWGPENTNEDASGFVGTATVALALLGVPAGLRRRRVGAATIRSPSNPGTTLRPQERLLQATVALSSFLLCLPASLRPWADRLPLALQSTSYYHRLLLLVAFGLACLAAYQLDRVVSGEGSRWAVLPLVAVVGALIVWGTLAHPPPTQPDPVAVLRLGSLHWHVRFLVATAAVVVFGRGRRWAGPAAAALVAAELLLVHTPANPPMPATLAFPKVPAISALEERLAGHRLVAVGAALPPNLAALYGLAAVQSYDPMAPFACARIVEPFERLEPVALLDSVTRRKLAGLGVSMAVAPPATPPPLGYRVVFADETATLLASEASPVVAVTGAAHGSRWSRDGSRVVVTLGSGGPSALATTICQDGGWTVLASGSRGRATPLSAAAAPAPFLGSPLPAGAKRLELLYRPSGFLAGCVLFSLGAAAALLLTLAPPSTAASIHPLEPRQEGW